MDIRHPDHRPARPACPARPAHPARPARPATFALGTLAVVLLVAATALAVDTEKVSLGSAGAYDDAVTITRTPDTDEMLFTDAVAGTVTLDALKSVATAHGTLTGLDADDHAHYLTAARHDDAHDATYNDALAIGADVGGNTTLGAHTADSAIHLQRAMPETIAAAWTFGGGLTSNAPVAAPSFVLHIGGTPQVIWYVGAGSPENIVVASVGSLYSRLDGGTGTALYVKESGSGSTGWAAK